MARIFIGVAWPYANGPFHIGHLAGAYLPADIFARYHRLRGDEVLMVSGSDMHGTPILIRAETEGASPEEVARRFDAINREALERLGFTYDLFTHTHTDVHERTVQETFLLLLENGLVARRTEANAFCPKHGRFLPDRYLVGECPHCGNPTARGDECDRCGRVLEPKQLIGPRCSLDGSPAEFRPSEHFYLLLDKLQAKVEGYVADKTHWRPNVAGVTRNFLTGGLRATPITRDLSWGVPIPLEGYETKRFYVWFDAIIGYLSASREWAIRSGKPEAWKRFWDPAEAVRSYYFIGKDNIFFHTIEWPAILIGRQGLKLPFDVPANEWLTIDGRKLAKSRPSGSDTTVPSLLKEYAPDVIRFYAALMAPQNHDTQFDWDEFHRVSEDILSNQYGNLVQRALVLTREREGGKIPTPPAGWTPDGSAAGRRIKEAHARIQAEYEAVRLKEALDLALTEVREGNRQFHEGKPWQASEGERRRILYETLWLVQATRVWLAPMIPFSSDAVGRMLGDPEALTAGGWDRALAPPPPGQRLGEIQPLFPRRETGSPATEPGSRPKSPSEEHPASNAPAVLDLRCAVIREAANHPSADKLYVLTLDSGEPSPRTVVAGIRPFYTLDELRGRRVAVLANLEPRTIRKMTSNGMVLAADTGDRAILLVPPESAPPGSVISGGVAGAPEVRFEEFSRTPLVVGRVTGAEKEGRVRVDVGGRELVVRGDYPTGTSAVIRLDAPDGLHGEILEFGGYGPLGVDPALAPGTRVR